MKLMLEVELQPRYLYNQLLNGGGKPHPQHASFQTRMKPDKVTRSELPAF